MVAVYKKAQKKAQGSASTCLPRFWPAIPKTRLARAQSTENASILAQEARQSVSQAHLDALHPRSNHPSLPPSLSVPCLPPNPRIATCSHWPGRQPPCRQPAAPPAGKPSPEPLPQVSRREQRQPRGQHVRSGLPQAAHFLCLARPSSPRRCGGGRRGREEHAVPPAAGGRPPADVGGALGAGAGPCVL